MVYSDIYHLKQSCHCFCSKQRCELGLSMNYSRQRVYIKIKWKNSMPNICLKYFYSTAKAVQVQSIKQGSITLPLPRNEQMLWEFLFILFPMWVSWKSCVQRKTKGLIAIVSLILIIFSQSISQSSAHRSLFTLYCLVLIVCLHHQSEHRCEY